jgi:hypothetical protein
MTKPKKRDPALYRVRGDSVIRWIEKVCRDRDGRYAILTNEQRQAIRLSGGFCYV